MGVPLSSCAIVGAGSAIAAFGTYANCAAAPSLGLAGAPGTARERTLILVKPDGVERAIVGEVITKFEKKGYKLVGIKMFWPSKEMAETNYEGLKTKPFFPGLVAYFSSGPVVAMCWEG